MDFANRIAQISIRRAPVVLEVYRDLLLIVPRRKRVVLSAKSQLFFSGGYGGSNTSSPDFYRLLRAAVQYSGRTRRAQRRARNLGERERTVVLGT